MGAGVQIVAAAGSKTGLYLSVALQYGVVVGIVDVSEPPFEGRQLLAQLCHVAGAGHGLGEDTAVFPLGEVLPEVADGEATRTFDPTLVRLLLAEDHPEHGGLAGAVRAHQAYLLAGVDLQGRVEEHHLGAVLEGDVGELDQGATGEGGGLTPLTADAPTGSP